MTHALIRTSPKGPGQAFIGRCTKCGKEDLAMIEATKTCPMDDVVSDVKATSDILRGKGFPS